MLRSASLFLADAARHDYEVRELEALLPARGLPWSHAVWSAAALKFWRSQRAHVHDCAVAQSGWNQRLGKLAWRVDVKQRERGDGAAEAPRQEPRALVEIVVQQPQQSGDAAATAGGEGGGGEARVLRFEMAKEQVAATTRQLEAVQRALDAASRK